MPQNLASASKKSIQQSRLGQLDNLGESKEDFEAGAMQVVEIVAGNFIDKVISNIQSEDMIVSGKIADISIKSENGQVNIYANPWLIYQDKGVNGSKHKLYNTPFSYKDKMPPMEVFRDYIKKKNLQLRNNTTYYGNSSPHADLTEDEQIDKAAWGMAGKVFNEGIKPRNIYTKEIPGLVQELNDEVAKFAAENINQFLKIDEKKTIKVTL
jgi:hypothetical protein